MLFSFEEPGIVRSLLIKHSYRFVFSITAAWWEHSVDQTVCSNLSSD